VQVLDNLTGAWLPELHAASGDPFSLELPLPPGSSYTINIAPAGELILPPCDGNGLPGADCYLFLPLARAAWSE